RVLDGQGRLGGEGFEQVDHLRRKLSRRLLVDGQTANEVILTQQRNGQKCAVSRPQQDITQGTAVRAFLADVWNLDRLARHGHAPHVAFTTADRSAPRHLDYLRVEVV